MSVNLTCIIICLGSMYITAEPIISPWEGSWIFIGRQFHDTSDYWLDVGTDGYWWELSPDPPFLKTQRWAFFGDGGYFSWAYHPGWFRSDALETAQLTSGGLYLDY